MRATVYSCIEQVAYLFFVFSFFIFNMIVGVLWVYEYPLYLSEAQKNAHLQKLSSRWLPYDDTQHVKMKQQEKDKKLKEDPYGDGLPF